MYDSSTGFQNVDSTKVELVDEREIEEVYVDETHPCRRRRDKIVYWTVKVPRLRY